MSRIPANRTMAIALVALSCSSVLSAAQPLVELHFREGRVWIAATNATTGDILREWKRAGGPPIVNGDAIEGSPVTLRLEGVSEREALALILRDTAGYIALLGTAGVDRSSSVKTIVVLPTSAAAVPAAVVSRPDAPALPNEPNPAGLPQPLLDAIGAIRQANQSAMKPK